MVANANVGAEARELRTMLDWSLDETCKRCKHEIERTQLSRFERGFGSMSEQQQTLLVQVLRSALSQRHKRLANVVAGWDAPENRVGASAWRSFRDCWQPKLRVGGR